MNTAKAERSWRRWFYVNLHTAAWGKRGLSPMNKFVGIIIILAVALAILQSEPMLYVGNEGLFRSAEIVFAVIFLAEYSARVWIAGENPEYGPTFKGRLRYVLTLPALIDLVALLSLFLTLVGTQGAILRLFRLVRIVALAKLGRYSTALNAIGYAIHSRRYELAMSLAIAGMLLLLSSTLLYMVEGDGQPDAFGSIPRAMWWSIATLTTVGYGDAIPHTPLGKILAGFTAITGIGLIAMPTGILASAFSDALQKERDAREREREARLKERGMPDKRN
jgi:voltage-gated potassium channel